jgi:ABC-type amino acid transport substrate-binding protein
MVAHSRLKAGLDFAAPIPLHTDLSSEKFEGFEVDLMKEIEKALNLTIEYKVAYWKDIISELMNGEIDIICSAATVTEERKKHVAFSRPYLHFHLALVCNKSNILSTDELKDKKIGVRVSTEAEDYLKNAFPGKELYLFDTNDEQYEKLSSREIDALVDDSPIAYGFTSNNPSIMIAETIDGTLSSYAMIIQKENVELQNRISTVISKLEQSGFLEDRKQFWFKDAKL